MISFFAKHTDAKEVKIEADWEIFPGHGGSTTLKAEQKNVPYWFSFL